MAEDKNPKDQPPTLEGDKSVEGAHDTPDKEDQDNPKDIDQSANRPGSVGRSAAHGSDSYGDTDLHELAIDRFGRFGSLDCRIGLAKILSSSA